MSGKPAMPHRGVKTTWGVVSRIGAPAIHSRRIPLIRLRGGVLRPRGPSAR